VPNYAAFGLTIASEIELGELTTAPNDSLPDWNVQVQSGAVPTIRLTPLGTDTVLDGVQVRGFAIDRGTRLAFDDTGTFDIVADSREIRWYPGSSANAAAVRADLLGRVLAAALHVDGRVALHASGISIDGRAIAVLGPKHAGKSTLAFSLVKRGARLLADDMLAVRLDDAGVAWAAPGVQRVRLWDDSARALGVATSRRDGGKPSFDCLTAQDVESAEVTLDACYVLHGSDDELVDGAVRTRLSPVHAAMAFVRFSKLGALAGGREGEAALDRAARLARLVPVFDLAIRRDLATVADAAECVLAWHRREATVPAGTRR
jgi:hypothetical protein